MRKLFRVLVILLLLVGAAVGLYALVHNGGKEQGKTRLVAVENGSITEKALAVGQIEPRQKFSIKSKIPGIVKTCRVQVGDRVRPGDALFEIAPDPTPTDVTGAGNAVSNAEASHEKARLDFERAASLFKQGVVSKSDYDAARTTFELAKLALQNARQNSELTLKGRVTSGGLNMESVIRSPAAGTVLTRAANPGDPVVPLTSYQPGTELASIADMGDLIFKGTVDEIDVGKMRVGLPTRIKVGALPADVVTGRVSRIAPQAQQKDGATLFDVEVELDHPDGIVLRAGYSANAEVIIREKKNVLTVPERVVIFEDGGKKAFVELPGIGPKAPPKKTEIRLGISDGMNVEVTSGLSAGQKVVERPPKEIS